MVESDNDTAVPGMAVHTMAFTLAGVLAGTNVKLQVYCGNRLHLARLIMPASPS